MKTLLLADPSPLMRDLLTATFAGQYRILEAEDGETALGLIQTERPDLVVLEVLLPRLSGLEVCRLIKADPDRLDTPVMFLTVAAEATTRALGLQVGADRYLTKPFSPTRLADSVRTLIEPGGSSRIHWAC